MKTIEDFDYENYFQDFFNVNGKWNTVETWKSFHIPCILELLLTDNDKMVHIFECF